jgi:hypothetical protein
MMALSRAIPLATSNKTQTHTTRPAMAARFDEGFRFDSGVRFDAEPAPVSNTRKDRRMAKLKLEIKSKNVDEKLSLGATHITAMAGNTTYPAATRVPSDADFAAAQDALDTANGDADAAEAEWKEKIEIRNQAEAAWDTVMTARGNNCEAVTPNDPVALASTGLPLRSQPVPVGDMPQPQNLRATMGAMQGTIVLKWAAIYGSSSFVVESKEDGSQQAWAQIKIQQKTKFTATGLTSGKTYAFRVHALGPKGDGPWSDVAVKMAP